MCEYAIVPDLAHHFLSMTAIEFKKCGVIHDSFVVSHKLHDFIIVVVTCVPIRIIMCIVRRIGRIARWCDWWCWRRSL